MAAAVYNTAYDLLADALGAACNQNCFSCEVKHDKSLLYSVPPHFYEGKFHFDF